MLNHYKDSTEPNCHTHVTVQKAPRGSEIYSKPQDVLTFGNIWLAIATAFNAMLIDKYSESNMKKIFVALNTLLSLYVFQF